MTDLKQGTLFKELLVDHGPGDWNRECLRPTPLSEDERHGGIEGRKGVHRS